MQYLKNTFLPFAVMASLAVLLFWTGPVAASPGLSATAGHAQQSPGCAWSIVSSSGSGYYDNLYATAGASDTDVWAVGYKQGFHSPRLHTLIQHWNGSSVSNVVSPSVGNGNNVLRGVAVVSSTSVWAVGYYVNGSGVSQALTEHWNGTKWKIVPSLNVGTGSNALLAVSVHTRVDVWAVGYYSNGSADQTLIEHWNGAKWRIIPSLNVGTGSNVLQAVAARDTTDVWAVGYYVNGSGIHQTLIERLVGTSWTLVASPNFGASSNYLLGVAIVSVNDVWSVGYYYDGNAYQTLTEHWDGNTWSIITSPNVGAGDNVLQGVSVDPSSSGVWVAGAYNDPNQGYNQPLIQYWDGSTWSVVSSPNTGVDTYLYGVAVVSPNKVWSAGYIQSGPSNPPPSIQPLFEHCS